MTTLPYRPPTPNEYWLEGEEARKAGLPRTQSVQHAYSGDRWEWEAGWDYADALRRDCPDCGHLQVNHRPGSGACAVPMCRCGSTTEDEAGYEPPGHQRGAGDGSITLPGRCSWCDCALTDAGLCVDSLCPGSREDDDDYFRPTGGRP